MSGKRKPLRADRARADALRAGAEGERHVVRIDGLAAGGDGVGRLPDGRAVFVPFTAPGDQVRLCVTERRTRFARGRLLEVLEPSPVRVAPRCDVFGSCGGCSWQHVDYAAQLEAKRGIVSDALRRLGGLAWEEPIAITPSPEPYGYRARTRVLVAGTRVGYRRRASHALCETPRCPVLAPELEARLARLASEGPAVDGEWELVTASGRTRAAPLGAPVGERADVAVAGATLRVSEGVFLQANALLHDALAGCVLEHCGRGGGALELYAGAGFFTLGLARRFGRVVAVELSETAVDDLRENLATAEVTNVDVRAGDGAGFAWPSSEPPPDVVLVDPPRAGLSPDVREALAASGAERLVYVSCDPATFARDAAALAERGFGLRHVEAFDLFPQTPHVELVARLERPPGGDDALAR